MCFGHPPQTLPNLGPSIQALFLASKKFYYRHDFREAEKSGKAVVTGKEKYILCRSDKNTKNRHVKRNHTTVKLDMHGNYAFIVDEKDKEAQRILAALEKLKSCNVEDKPVASVHLEPVSATNEVKAATIPPMSTLQKQIESAASSKSDDGRNLDQLGAINSKLDALTATMENLTLQLKGKSKGSKELGPLLAVGSKNIEEAFQHALKHFPKRHMPGSTPRQERQKGHSKMLHF